MRPSSQGLTPLAIDCRPSGAQNLAPFLDAPPRRAPYNSSFRVPHRRRSTMPCPPTSGRAPARRLLLALALPPLALVLTALALEVVDAFAEAGQKVAAGQKADDDAPV